MAHLVWDWNGTLLDDLALVVEATNASLATFGGPQVTAHQHRLDYRRPISDYYAYVLGRPITQAEFVQLDDVFHAAYRAGLESCRLALDAHDAISQWVGTQSLLSMFFHDELIELAQRHGVTQWLARVDGLRARVGGGPKAPHLAAHLAQLGIDGSDCVLIGDSVDDAEAARSVGARAVLYDGGFTDGAKLRATGLPVASTLLEAIKLANPS